MQYNMLATCRGIINQELTTSAYLQSKGSECLEPPTSPQDCLLKKIQAVTITMDMIPVSLHNMAKIVYRVTFIRFEGSLKQKYHKLFYYVK